MAPQNSRLQEIVLYYTDIISKIKGAVRKMT